MKRNTTKEGGAIATAYARRVLMPESERSALPFWNAVFGIEEIFEQPRETKVLPAKDLPRSGGLVFSSFSSFSLSAAYSDRASKWELRPDGWKSWR